MANLYYKLIVFMLGSLGMSCDRSSPTIIEYGPPVAEYGMPYVRLIIDGEVLKAADQSPLDGIEVKLQDITISTDAAGAWSLDMSTSPCDVQGFIPCTLYVSDIDGPINGGEFAPTRFALQLVQTSQGDGSWYLGVYEQHAITIELDETSGK